MNCADVSGILDHQTAVQGTGKNIQKKKKHRKITEEIAEEIEEEEERECVSLCDVDYPQANNDDDDDQHSENAVEMNLQSRNL